MPICKVYAGVFALVIFGFMTACGSSPSSPTDTTQGSGDDTGMSTTGDSDLTQTATDPLKATAPTPISPQDSAMVSLSPTLEVSTPQAIHGVSWSFDVRFEIFEGSNQASAVYSGLVPQGQGNTSHTVPDGLLQNETYYVWRARGESEGQGGPWSELSSFTTQNVTIGQPTPIEPIGGVVTTTLRPQLFVINPPTTGTANDIGQVLVEFEVSTDNQFSTIVEFGRTTARSRGETGYTLLQALTPETQFYWRARGTNRDLPITAILDPQEVGINGQALVEITSGWSSIATFSTPTEEAASSGGTFGGAGSSPNAPFTTDGGNAPNLLAVIQGVAAEHPAALQNSCQTDGGTWEFMDRSVEALRAIDGRWGYNCKRGDCTDLSLDVVVYYMGSGTSTAEAQNSSAVDIFDIIVAHCGPSPTVGFNSLTDETEANGTIGRWKYPR